MGNTKSTGGSTKGTKSQQEPINLKLKLPEDHEIVTINTSNGPKKMTAGQYRARYRDAEKWVSEQAQAYQNQRGHTGAKEPDWGELYRQAADKFGLDRNWHNVTNPIIHGK